MEIFEKNDDVGGTWLENHYPGCRVDVPNHLYSYSFAQRDNWPQQFSTAGCAARLLPRTAPTTSGSRDHIRFGTEVLTAEYQRRRRGDWKLTVRNPDGTEAAVEVHALVERGRPAQPAEPPEDRGP